MHLYSQINYLGSFLTFTARETQRLSLAIEDFVKGNLNILLKRFLLTPAEGGLGLFNLNNFLDAQRCSWVKRAQNLDDIWKRTLYAACYGSILNIRASKINKDDYPILHGIVNSYEKFYANHTKWNENYKIALIFDNPALTLNLRTLEVADEEYFGALFNVSTVEIFKLRLVTFTELAPAMFLLKILS